MSSTLGTGIKLFTSLVATQLRRGAVVDIHPHFKDRFALEHPYPKADVMNELTVATGEIEMLLTYHPLPVINLGISTLGHASVIPWLAHSIDPRVLQEVVAVL